MHRIISILITSILLSSFLPISLAIPMPIGVGGKVTINGEPVIINITIINTYTEETYTKTTNENGFYACALSGSDGDEIKISLEYNGNTYTNTTYVNLSHATQWLNLSIHITDGDGGGSDSSSSPPTPPPSPPSYPPHADFTYIPSTPHTNETITFISLSTDPDNDIINFTWTVENSIYYGESCEHQFRQSGAYTVVLIVTDAENHISIAQKSVEVLNYNEENEESENNQSQNQNITIIITIKDKENDTLPNVPIEIYDENDTLVQTAYTDDNGTATVTIPQGSYHISANYGNQHKTKRLTFTNDGRVTFLFDEETQETYEQQPTNTQQSQPFNIFLVIPFIIVGVVVLIYLKLRWWQS